MRTWLTHYSNWYNLWLKNRLNTVYKLLLFTVSSNVENFVSHKCYVMLYYFHWHNFEVCVCVCVCNSCWNRETHYIFIRYTICLSFSYSVCSTTTDYAQQIRTQTRVSMERKTVKCLSPSLSFFGINDSNHNTALKCLHK